jgi:hypothetical protein
MALVSLVLLSSVTLMAVLVFVLGMICIDSLGILYYWNISLNAVTVINLVWGIGISVEFCAHLALRFMQLGVTSKLERSIGSLTGTIIFHSRMQWLFSHWKQHFERRIFYFLGNCGACLCFLSAISSVLFSDVYCDSIGWDMSWNDIDPSIAFIYWTNISPMEGGF